MEETANNTNNDKWITPKQVEAKLFGVVKYRTILNMIWGGDFGNVKQFGKRKIAVSEAAVDAYIASHNVTTASKQGVDNG